MLHFFDRMVLLLILCALVQAAADWKKLRGSYKVDWQPNMTGELVDCSMNDTNSLLLLTSSGLGDYASGGDSLVPDWNTVNAFRDLVLQLPDSAWDVDGAAKKKAARSRDISMIAARNFTEPDLYSGLTVVVLEDPCFLYDSFWNEANPNFNRSIGINYMTTRMHTDVELVRPFFGEDFGDEWCVNYSAKSPGYLGGLGFESSQIRHVSLWDQIANNTLKEAVFNLTFGGLPGPSIAKIKANATGKKAAAMINLLNAADILIVNGGNPDFAKFVYMHFASKILKPVIQKVKSGQVVFSAQSAGAMIGAADIGLTYSNPNVFEKLLAMDSSGLKLAGTCAIRPHDTGLSASKYDLASAVYGRLKGLTVARLSNGEALKCTGTTCQVVGGDGQLGASIFQGPNDPDLQRLADAFQNTL